MSGFLKILFEESILKYWLNAIKKTLCVAVDDARTVHKFIIERLLVGCASTARNSWANGGIPKLLATITDPVALRNMNNTKQRSWQLSSKPKFAQNNFHPILSLYIMDDNLNWKYTMDESLLKVLKSMWINVPPLGRTVLFWKSDV